MTWGRNEKYLEQNLDNVYNDQHKVPRPLCAGTSADGARQIWVSDLVRLGVFPRIYAMAHYHLNIKNEMEMSTWQVSNTIIV